MGGASSSQLYSLGVGDCGQLGHGDTKCHVAPKKVDFLTGKDVAMVSAGGQQSAAVRRGKREREEEGGE